MNEKSDNSALMRHLGEAGVMAAIIAVFWTLDTLAKHNLRLVDGGGLDNFRLIAEQTTSAFSVWVLVPAVAWWLTRFPISPGQVISKAIGHVIGSMLFAVAHYTLMIGLRAAIYPLFGTRYVLSDFWFRNLIIEYQKDLKIYVAIVGIVALYRWVRENRKQPDAGRLVVQSGTTERLLDYAEIEYLEASRNYVSVFAGGKEFLLRETIANLEKRLQEHRFVRTHRSYLVNQQHIAGIKPNESGGHNLILASGHEVPLSRSRREEVRKTLGI